MFSFGMTMWSVLCPPGTNPGLGNTSIQISKSLDKEKRPPLSGIDENLSNLIAQCWHHDRFQRPTATDVVDALRNARDLAEAAAASNARIPVVFSSELWQTVLRFTELEAPYTALQWQETDISGLSLSAPLKNGDPCLDFLRSQLDPQFDQGNITRIAMVGLGNSSVSSFVTQHRAEAHSRAVNHGLQVEKSIHVTAAIDRLKAAFLPIDKDELDTARIALVWHGTSPENVIPICRDRPRSLRTTDSGFFGAGSYFALEVSYAARFPMGPHPPERAMILFAVSVSQAKVITVTDDYRLHEESAHLAGYSKYYSGDPQLAVALAPKYDAHFIPVKQYGYKHPRTGHPTACDVDYQACDEHEATAHELVISSHHRCIPIAVMYFSGK